MASTDYNVDLTNCDREPIHIPGYIQSHGCLIACDNAMRMVLRHSENCREILRVDGDINGRTAEEVLGKNLVHDLRNALHGNRQDYPPCHAAQYGTARWSQLRYCAPPL